MKRYQTPIIDLTPYTDFNKNRLFDISCIYFDALISLEWSLSEIKLKHSVILFVHDIRQTRIRIELYPYIE